MFETLNLISSTLFFTLNDFPSEMLLIEYDGRTFMFWLINPRGFDDQGREYEMEVRWWFKQVPMEVRKLSEQIINDFKDAKDDSSNSTRDSKSI